MNSEHPVVENLFCMHETQYIIWEYLVLEVKFINPWNKYL